MHLVLQVLATAQAIDKAGQRLFKPHGLTVAQFNVLNLLADQPEGMRASDLAAALVVDPSNVTGLLRRMDAAGYLTAVTNPQDARQRIVKLSAKGRRMWERTHPEYRRTLDTFEASLGAHDREAIAAFLAGMAEAAARFQ